MRTIDRILIVQTAFLGDVVLTLPLLQVTRDFFAGSKVDILVVPRSADICQNHPDINEIIEFDKNGSDRGISGFRRTVGRLRKKDYHLALIPHRSLRSASLAFLAGIPLRVGFTKSTGKFLFTKRVPYEKQMHEIERNLSLLSGLGINALPFQLPRVFPSPDDRRIVHEILQSAGISNAAKVVGIAPGTIWNTKRWLKEGFSRLSAMLVSDGYQIILMGSKDDVPLCEEVKLLSGVSHVHNFAGKLSILQSAELIRRCSVMVSNDSAPMHLSVSVGTPVVAIFGATVPAFGFAPRGEHDIVVETRGLSCRPCSIHGGATCPINTFECMNKITPERVYLRVRDILQKPSLQSNLSSVVSRN